MTLWEELVSEVYSWTNRPDRVAETSLAIRQAIRTAHRSGKYWRDLITSTVVPTGDALQSIDLSSAVTRFRQVAYLKTANDLFLKPVTIDDLVDADGYMRTDVYWGVGTNLQVRAASPQTQYELCYYQNPLVGTDTVNSWIAGEHRDLIVLWAASSVLGLLGEQEIKSRADQLAAIAFADLQQDNLEVQGR